MKTCGQCGFMPVHRIDNPSRLGGCSHKLYHGLVGDDYPACKDFAPPGTLVALLRRLETAVMWNASGRAVLTGDNVGTMYDPAHKSAPRTRRKKTDGKTN